MTEPASETPPGPVASDAHGSPRRRRRLLFWLAIAVGGLLLCVLLVVAAWLLFVPGDIPEVDDGDLLLAEESIPEEENGYTLLEQACAALDTTEEFGWSFDLLDSAPDELDESESEEVEELRSSGWVESVLEINREALTLVEKACSRPRMRLPLGFDGPFSEITTLSRLLLLRSWELRGHGRDEESLADILMLLRLGRMLRGGRGPLITHVVGAFFVGRAHVELRESLEVFDLSCTRLRELAGSLDTPAEIQQSFADALRGDYSLFRRIVEEFAGGDRNVDLDLSPFEQRISRLLLQPNRTRQVLADQLRRPIQTRDRHYSKMLLPEMPEELTHEDKLKAILSGNPVGIVFLAAFMPAVETAARKKCHATISLHATRIHLALACYQQEHGELPPDLEALVPDYLDAVPLDDFDGKPMRYSAEKKIVYSVGRDLIDSGGEEGFSTGEGDHVYPIGF
ncbi:MAG: hypothetical protein ACE5GW_06800 [Planctomycetota bacterium]